MSAVFGRDALLDAFDRIGRAAALADTKLQIAVYGGSARMLASNFRFATEDVDVSELERPLPGWLAAVVHEIARQNGWQDDLFNDGSRFISVRSRTTPRIIWSSERFREMALRRDLWFRCHRQNICLR